MASKFTPEIIADFNDTLGMDMVLDDKEKTKKEKRSSGEFERFDNAMKKLLKVPHSKIKAELDSEKATKKQKPRKEKKNG